MEIRKNTSYLDFYQIFHKMGCFSINQIHIWNDRFNRNNLGRWVAEALPGVPGGGDGAGKVHRKSRAEARGKAFPPTMEQVAELLRGRRAPKLSCLG